MRWDGLRLSVSLLTVLPVRGEPGPVGRREAGAAIAWAPAVGLGLGAVGAGVLLLVAGPLGAGRLTGAALAVAALAALTRGLHLDGLADLADGLGSGKPAAQALDIMRSGDVGPFGVVTLVLTLLIQVAAVAQAETEGRGRGAVALIAAAVTGRLALTWACRPGVPAARADGLGAMVAGTVRPATAYILTTVTLAAAAGAVIISATAHHGSLGWTLPAAVAAGLAAALALQRHAVRRLGGITGDVLGALVETATTVCLVVAVLARGDDPPIPPGNRAAVPAVTSHGRGPTAPRPRLRRAIRRS